MEKLNEGRPEWPIWVGKWGQTEAWPWRRWRILSLKPQTDFWDGLKPLPFFLMWMSTKRHFDPITTASLLLTVTPRGRNYVLLTFQRRTQWVRVVM